MKLDRLLAITMTLLTQRRVNATELAGRFEVSLRTIYRDMESINQAGIPIVSFAGSDGGFEVMPGYRLDKQFISLDDLSSIYSALRGAHSILESKAMDGLLDRIGALMMSGPGQAPGANGIDVDLAPAPNDKEKLGALHQAIRTTSLVRFSYLNAQGSESERTIEPMGLFLKGYVWYLYGYCLHRSDFRVFRVSRILDPALTGRTFVRRDYSLLDVENQFMSKANFSKVQATLFFRPEVRTRVRDEFGHDRIESTPDGSVCVKASFSSMERAVQKILSFGEGVKVEDCPELVAELRRHVRAMMRNYEISENDSTS